MKLMFQLAPIAGHYAPVQAGLDIRSGLTASCPRSLDPRPREYGPCPQLPTDLMDVVALDAGSWFCMGQILMTFTQG